MIQETRRLAKAPIVEAVLDFDCDLPPGVDIEALEGQAQDLYSDHYPKPRTRYLLEHAFQAIADEPPKTSTRRGVQGYMFLSDDEKQLVQVRAQGFSFNRLAPYTSLDEYLPEIERTWRLYAHLAEPLQVNNLRLRYINRIDLPLDKETVRLDEYLENGPRLFDEETMRFAGFLHQYEAVEMKTGHEVKTILASQPPEHGMLPIILDITVANASALAADEWEAILETIQSLRRLKNRVFHRTISEKCLQLFQ